MYSRLWWKETRTFWPIWVALGILAVGIQGFLLLVRTPFGPDGHVDHSRT